MKKLLLILILLTPILSFAQLQDQVWVFGYHNGLDFSTHPPTFRNTAINSWFQTASISDNQGQLLFFTDGVKVYEPSGQPMLNGNLQDSLFVQKANKLRLLIFKSASQPNQYYIFELINNALYYSLVDMSLNSGKGAIIQKGERLTQGPIMDILPAKGSDCFSSWLIATSYNDQKFLSFKLDQDGLHDPVQSAGIDSYWHAIDTEQFYSAPVLQMNPDYSKLVSIRYKNLQNDHEGDSSFYFFRRTNILGFEICDFNKQTGVFSNPTFISQNFQNQQDVNWISSICFSPNGKFLYTSRLFDDEPNSGIKPTELAQFNMALLPDTTAFKNSKIIINTPQPNESPLPQNNYMRSGTDGKIYLTFNPDEIYLGRKFGIFWGTSYLGCIQAPDSPGTAANYQEKYLVYPGSTQFPQTELTRAGSPRNNDTFFGFYLPAPTLNQEFSVAAGETTTHLLCNDIPVTISATGDYDRY